MSEGPDRPKNPNRLDAPLLVDGGLDHNGPVDAARNGIRWVSRLNAVNKLRRGHAANDTDRFPTGRRRPLPPPDTTLDSETRADPSFEPKPSPLPRPTLSEGGGAKYGSGAVSSGNSANISARSGGGVLNSSGGGSGRAGAAASQQVA